MSQALHYKHIQLESLYFFRSSPASELFSLPHILLPGPYHGSHSPQHLTPLYNYFQHSHYPSCCYLRTYICIYFHLLQSPSFSFHLKRYSFLKSHNHITLFLASFTFNYLLSHTQPLPAFLVFPAFLPPAQNHRLLNNNCFFFQSYP